MNFKILGNEHVAIAVSSLKEPSKVFGDTLVFSDLESAKLSKQKMRMVTLSGCLLYTSDAADE